MIYFTIFLSSIISSAILSAILLKVLTKYSILDIPTERSNHKLATPRGGGIAIIVPFLIFLSTYYFLYNKSTTMFLILGLMIVATISFIDDLRNLPILPRLIFQSIGAALILQHLPIYLVLPHKIIATVAIVAFMNFYNFMDGIDGSATSEAIHIGISIFVISLLVNNLPKELSLMSIALAGASLGFLKFNWHPAKIFLGDVGSISLGLISAWMLSTLALSGYPAAAIIIPLYYIADSSLTLLKRLIKKEKIWLPHSEHFFQKAVRKGKSHAKVTTRIILINICLFGLSIYSLRQPVIALTASILLTSFFLYRLGRNSLRTKL